MRRPVDPTRRPRSARLQRGPASPPSPAAANPEIVTPVDRPTGVPRDDSAATAGSPAAPAPWDLPTSATPLAPEAELSPLSRLVTRGRQNRVESSRRSWISRLPLIRQRANKKAAQRAVEEDNPFLSRLRESRRAERRVKRKRILGATLLLAFCAAVFWAVAYSPLFALERTKITVEQAFAEAEPVITPNRVVTSEASQDADSNQADPGQTSSPEPATTFQFIDPATALAQAYPYEGISLARLPVGRIRSAIVDQLPAAQSVSLDRQWPNGLRITIIERTPVARVAQGESATLVDAEGVEIAQVALDDPRGAVVPQLIVPLGDSEVTGKLVDDCLQALRDLRVATLKKLASITADESSGVVFVLSDGAKVRWGDASEGELKGAVLETLLQTPHRFYDVSAPRNPITRD